MAWRLSGFNEDFTDVMSEEFISLIEDVVGGGVGLSDDVNEGEQPDERVDDVGDGWGEG